MIKQANIVPDISGLDLGISRRKLTRGLQLEVRMSPAKVLKGDTKIKSWYDGNGRTT
jgi:hypothetical protein